jgi:hypothetical protein
MSISSPGRASLRPSNTYLYVCIFVFIYINVCMCVCMYIYIYIYIHTYIQLCIFMQPFYECSFSLDINTTDEDNLPFFGSHALVEGALRRDAAVVR